MIENRPSSRSRRRPTRAVALLAALALVLAACGDDDGEAVRDGAGESGSASGSASGVASGSASGVSGEGPRCEPVGDPSTADRDVDAVLTEWEIDLDPTEVEAGTITFLGDNAGTEPHELLVVEGDDPAALETDEHGAVVESAIEDVIVGEVEPFPSGSRCDGTFDLAPGDYLIICNIVDVGDDGEVVSHFARGMVASFTVD